MEVWLAPPTSGPNDTDALVDERSEPSETQPTRHVANIDSSADLISRWTPLAADRFLNADRTRTECPIQPGRTERQFCTRLERVR